MVDGPNTYGFCGGDPVNRSDPMGTYWLYFTDQQKAKARAAMEDADPPEWDLGNGLYGVWIKRKVGKCIPDSDEVASVKAMIDRDPLHRDSFNYVKGHFYEGEELNERDLGKSPQQIYEENVDKAFKMVYQETVELGLWTAREVIYGVAGELTGVFLLKKVGEAYKVIRYGRNAERGAEAGVRGSRVVKNTVKAAEDVVDAGRAAPWRQPGQRVLQRAGELVQELRLPSNGVTDAAGHAVRELKPHELLALSEKFGREYSLIQHRTKGWILFSGDGAKVASKAGRDILRRVHTHPGTGVDAAVASLRDLENFVLHRSKGGQGALEIWVRDASGQARAVQRGVSESRMLLDLEQAIQGVQP